MGNEVDKLGKVSWKNMLNYKLARDRESAKINCIIILKTQGVVSSKWMKSKVRSV